MDYRDLMDRMRDAAESWRLRERLQRMREEVDRVRRERCEVQPAPVEPVAMDWVIRLRPLKSFAAPVICRMRRLLKSALRCFGFKVVTYRQVPIDEPLEK